MTEYTPDRPIRMVELFAGIGAQASAMERLGLPFTSVVSEIDDRAYRAYCAIHGDTPNLGDITKVEHLPECDLVTYSFPCLTGDTLVETKDGCIPIRDVEVGMKVMTDKGYRTVIASAQTGVKPVRTLETPFGSVRATDYHPFYACQRNGDGSFTEPDYIKVSDLKAGMFLCRPLISDQPIPGNTDAEIVTIDGMAWFPITSISEPSEPLPVFDITVEGRHCFIANGILCKNCQDISMAGRQKGFTEGSGTRSALLWEVQRLLEDMKERNCLPEVLLMENVDALLNKKNLPNFQKWCNVLSEMGYTNSYQVLNAKDYGIPQNRKRVFMVSTLHMGEFVFPPKQPLELRLKDMLEDDVDESYYLSPERIAAYEQHKKEQEAKGNGFGYKPMDPLKFDTEPEQCDADGNTVTVRKGEIAHALTNKEARQVANFIVEREKEGEDSPDDVPIEVKGNLNLEGRFESACRVYGQEGVAPTLPTGGGGGIIPKIEVDSQAEIEVKGDLNIEGRLESACRVYGTDGLIPTIPARSGDMTPKIEVAGDLHNGSTQNSVVISPDGLAPALMASAGSKGNHVRIEVDAQPKIAGSLGDGYHANNDVYDTDGVAPVQRANAHGNNTLIEVKDSEGCIEVEVQEGDPQ